MQVRLTVPSKTFLIGEYAVLKGGSALVLATEPRFQAIISTPGEGRLENIHRNSPAGLWARENKETFQNIDFTFTDPHEGRGGFGASSAQFLLTWIWNQLESTPFSKLSEGVDLQAVLGDYKSLFEQQKIKPSGADVVAQSTGGLTQLSMNPLKVDALEWPFEDLDFLIVPTGKKIPTHTHLESLTEDGLENLKTLANDACAAVRGKNRDGLIECLRKYAEELDAQNKVAEHTRSILKKWSAVPGVLAAKGCGALGSDSFVLLVEKEKSLELREKLTSEKLPVLASALSLSPGLGMQLDLQGEVKPVTVKTPDGLVK